MIERIEYRVIAVDSDGVQYDITGATSGLGWSEGEKELAAKITLKVANIALGDRYLSDLVRPFTPIIIYAEIGAGFQEVIRGRVQKWELEESNGEFTLNLEAADEAQDLRTNQDDLYFTDGHSTSAILEEILNKHNIAHEIKLVDGVHSKKVYRRKYLSDMVADVLKDLKEKGGGVYFVRARAGVIEIIGRGTNEITYHFDIENNLVRVRESFDVGKTITKVQVVGKDKGEGHQRVETTIEGNVAYGLRQVIYERGDKESMQDAELAAKKILEEKGGAERKTTIEAMDVPTLRKGDRIRIRSSAGESYFFVKSIRHDAAQCKMTVELDEDKEKNLEEGAQYETNSSDESDSSAAP